MTAPTPSPSHALTPAQQVARTRCRCCGAVTPARETVPLEAIIGQEHAKRAIEVALAGDHSLCFEGVGNAEQAVQLAERARVLGLTAYAVLPCPCGYHGDAERDCTCTPAMMTHYRNRPAIRQARRADLFIEVPRPSADKLRRWRDGYRGEPEAHILARVAEARTHPVPSALEMTRAAFRLEDAAICQLHLTPERVERMEDVAASVARLAGAAQISPAHLAEALQYTRNGEDWAEGITE